MVGFVVFGGGATEGAIAQNACVAKDAFELVEVGGTVVIFGDNVPTNAAFVVDDFVGGVGVEEEDWGSGVVEAVAHDGQLSKSYSLA